MIEVVLQGQTLKANLLNPEVSKRYEDGFDKVVKTFNEAAKCERGSDGIRMQCQAVIDYVTDIFGEEQAKKVFGESTDLLECMDIIDLTEIQDLHWWKFKALFDSLNEETQMKKIMYYRKVSTSGMDRDRRAYINEMKKLYSLSKDKKKMTLEQRNVSWIAYVKSRKQG